MKTRPFVFIYMSTKIRCLLISLLSKKNETGNGFSVEHLLDYNSDGSINKIVRQKICDILTSLSNCKDNTWSVIKQNDIVLLNKYIRTIIKGFRNETD